MTIAKITIAIATMFVICKAASAQQGCAYCPCTQRLYPLTPATLCQSECRPSLACAASCISVNLPASLPITEAEKKTQRETHPKLKCYSVIEKPKANPNYNCIADIIGIKDEYIYGETVDGYGNRNGKLDVSDFDIWFSKIQFKPSANCGFTTGRKKIALYGVKGSSSSGSVFAPTHVARQVSGGLFESKEGRWKKIRHGAGDMVGGEYGELIKCYER